MRFDAVFKGSLTVLGIAAVALVAAILDSPVDLSGESGSGPVSTQSGAVDAIAIPEMPPFVQVLFLVVATLLAGLVVLHIIDEPMENLLTVVGVVLGATLILGIYTLFHVIGAGPGFPTEGTSWTGAELTGPTSNSGGNVNAATLVVTTLGGFFVVFVGLVLYLRSKGTPSNEVTANRSPLDGDVSAAAVGAAAGRAATQIESASQQDTENEIYRAWKEMTTLLPVESPQTTTPREFEAAAVEVGLERADVSDLTELFEAVRYGTEEVTHAREEQAIDILRRIESTYAVDDESEVDS
ncbi:hypothetical protein C479_15662 [Halovivax asiaticus JCM 14624]|uniref:Protein-glutamine gamma-glutamyltransferase-like C-terminal domain-containing protein n=1 Tax=Halovivax asiaticus JCM 14624 TaxID=1227490 RepID=M0B830_9EURY|nr:DUF4129 domain-containing protein [Halovivax asiaticus]ELZ07056.1 hypothetical protein C479_15662 [Halovivax asiaticus JCM 14624]